MGALHSPVTPKPMPALTQLSPDETLFRDTVRDFARAEIAPLVRSMDEEQKFEPKLLRKLFELGLMGVQVPEQYGGAAGTLFEAVLAVEEIRGRGAAGSLAR